jgi:hypothetical protein
MADTPTGISAGAILEIVAILLPLLKDIISPELSQQIDRAIMDFRKTREEKKKALLDAVTAMDVPRINVLLNELL